MPTYDYECTGCGCTFEAFQKITDKPLDKCPKCNQQVKRLIGSGSGIIFKGAGFYATDYRKKVNSKAPDSKRPTCPNASKGCNACNQDQ